MNQKTSFENWLDHVHMDVESILQLLQVGLSDEGDELISDLSTIETWYARTGYFLAEANSYLDEAKKYYMPGKDKGTEMERRAILDDAVRYHREWRDKIESIHEAIKTRITLGQSLLAYKRQSLENSKVLRTVDKPF